MLFSNACREMNSVSIKPRRPPRPQCPPQNTFLLTCLLITKQTPTSLLKPIEHGLKENFRKMAKRSKSIPFRLSLLERKFIRMVFEGQGFDPAYPKPPSLSLCTCRIGHLSIKHFNAPKKMNLDGRILLLKNAAIFFRRQPKRCAKKRK